MNLMMVMMITMDWSRQYMMMKFLNTKSKMSFRSWIFLKDVEKTKL